MEAFVAEKALKVDPAGLIPKNEDCGCCDFP
jgi:hypothetical protein